MDLTDVFVLYKYSLPEDAGLWCVVCMCVKATYSLSHNGILWTCQDVLTVHRAAWMAQWWAALLQMTASLA